MATKFKAKRNLYKPTSTGYGNCPSRGRLEFDLTQCEINQEFYYKAKPIDQIEIQHYKFNKEDIRPFEKGVFMSLGFTQSDRQTYANFLMYASAYTISDYIRSNTYSGMPKKYLKYLDRFSLVDKGTLKDLEQDKQLLQEHIATSVYEFAKMLVNAYQELDRQILEEEIDESEFMYEGFSEYMRHTHKNELKYMLPQIVEGNKWLYVLYNFTDDDMIEIHNPYIRKIFIDKIFRNPVYDIPMDLDLTQTKLARNNGRLLKQLEKRFKTAIINQKVLRRHGMLDENETLCYTLPTYLDGQELEISISNYVFALRFNNVTMNRLLGRNFNENVSIAKCALFCGYQGVGGLNAARELYTIKLNACEESFERLQARLREDINEEEKEDIEYELMYIEQMIKQTQRLLQSLNTPKELVNITYEQILSNVNARNVTGAIYGLQANQRNSYIEEVQEVERKEITIKIDKSMGDFKA